MNTIHCRVALNLIALGQNMFPKPKATYKNISDWKANIHTILAYDDSRFSSVIYCNQKPIIGSVGRI